MVHAPIPAAAAPVSGDKEPHGKSADPPDAGAGLTPGGHLAQEKGTPPPPASGTPRRHVWWPWAVGAAVTIGLVLVIALSKGGMVASITGPSTIAIGGVAPVTGEAASFGLAAKNGYELAVAEWNDRGGVLGKQIKLVFADDHGDPAAGAAAYTQLIQQDKVVAILGPVMSKVALAGAPICQAAQIPMMGATCTNPRVTLTGDYIYRACFIDPFQGTLGAKFAFEVLNAKKAACLFDIGNDYTKGLSEFFRTKFTALGGQIVAYEGHSTGTTDFTPQLTTILAGAPDVLYVSDYYNDTALIARQVRELGFNGPLIGGDGWDSPKLVEVGGPAVEGCFFTNHYSQDDTSTITQAFIRRYRAKHNADPDALSALGYDAANLMLDAIQRAGSTDGPAIKAALARTNLKVVTGQVIFGSDRNPVKSGVIIEIKDGRQVYRTTINP